MSEVPVRLRSEPAAGPEILPPGSVLVIEQGYIIPFRMRTAYDRGRGRRYQVLKGGDELLDTKPDYLGYTPTDTVVTFLQPNEWTTVTTEMFGVLDSRNPFRKYLVVNQNGEVKTHGYSNRKARKLSGKFRFVEPGSRQPTNTIILNPSVIAET